MHFVCDLRYRHFGSNVFSNGVRLSCLSWNWNFASGELISPSEENFNAKKTTFVHCPQKAEAVRKHLKDRIPVSQIADEMDVQPTMIHNWINSVLSQAEHLLEPPRAAKAEASKQDAALQKLREKLDSKNEVIAELMEENIRSKKANGEL